MRQTIVNISNEGVSYAKGDRKANRQDRKANKKGGGVEDDGFKSKVGTIAGAAGGLLGGIAGLATAFKRDKSGNVIPVQQPIYNTAPDNDSSKKYLWIGIAVVGGIGLVTITYLIAKKNK